MKRKIEKKKGRIFKDEKAANITSLRLQVKRVVLAVRNELL